MLKTYLVLVSEVHSTCIYSMILIFNLCANVLSHSKKTKKTTILRIYEGLGGIDSKIIALTELRKFYARLTSKSSFLSFCGGCVLLSWRETLVLLERMYAGLVNCVFKIMRVWLLTRVEVISWI